MQGLKCRYKIYSFNKAMRPSMISTERTPGPGAYVIETKLKKNGPIIPKASKDEIHMENLPVMF